VPAWWLRSGGCSGPGVQAHRWVQRVPLAQVAEGIRPHGCRGAQYRVAALCSLAAGTLWHGCYRGTVLHAQYNTAPVCWCWVEMDGSGFHSMCRVKGAGGHAGRLSSGCRGMFQSSG
jgi:hypothetical protein